MKLSEALLWAVFTFVLIGAAYYHGKSTGFLFHRDAVREAWCLNEGGLLSEAGDLCVVRNVVRLWPPHLTYTQKVLKEEETPAEVEPRSVYDMEPF